MVITESGDRSGRLVERTIPLQDAYSAI
jgi:hypothetical protein